METIQLKIFDETLRDGEQQAGLFFPWETKHRLAHEIAACGVDYIDIMPYVDPSEATLVKSLVSEGFDGVITPAAMTGKRFIDQAKACGVKRIIMFHALSDRLIFLRDHETRSTPLFNNKTVEEGIPEAEIERIREEVKEKILENLRYATSAEVGLEVDFAAEDASRSDVGYLAECIRAFRPYLGHFMLCDTVGILSPVRTYHWVHELLKETDHAPLAVHFHNDLGMALENTIQGIVAGATMVSGTFGGIGERAGNVALEQVFNGLRARFGVEVEGIDYSKIRIVTDHLKEIGAVPAEPYSKEANRLETGIHVHSMLRDRRSYSIFPYDEPEIWFGKFSGASNYQHLFEKQLMKSLPAEVYDQLRSKVKELVIQNERSFTVQDVLELYEEMELGCDHEEKDVAPLLGNGNGVGGIGEGHGGGSHSPAELSMARRAPQDR